MITLFPDVGMGNDPINGTDEDGGLFGVNVNMLCPCSSIFLETTKAAFSAIGPIAGIVANYINIAGNAINTYNNTFVVREQINRQFTSGVGQRQSGPGLDGVKTPGSSHDDVEKRLRLAATKKIKSNLKNKNSLLKTTRKVIQGAVVVLVADDAFGIGIADDELIPVLEVVNGVLWGIDMMQDSYLKFSAPGNSNESKYQNKDKPPFAKDAEPGKKDGIKGWYDKKGNFITKGDKPGEWHVKPNPNNRKPLWKGQKPRGSGNDRYWNVKDDGTIHH